MRGQTTSSRGGLIPMIQQVGEAIRRLVPHLRTYWWQIGGALLLTGLAVGVDLLRPLLYRALFDTAIATSSYVLVIQLLAGLVVLAVVRTTLAAGESYARSQVGDRITNRYRRDVFTQALHLPMAAIDNMDSGVMVNRITRESGTIGMVISEQLIPMVATVLRVLGLAVLLFVMDWRIGLLAVLTFPLSLLLTGRYSRENRDLDKQYLGLMERGQSFLQEILANVREVRAAGREAYEVGRWDEWLRATLRINVKFKLAREFRFALVYQLIDGVGLALVYGFGAAQVIAGSFTLGGLVAAASYATQLYASLKATMLAQVMTGPVLNALHSVEAVLAQPREWPDQGSQHLGAVRGGVAFDHVSFHYPGTPSGVQDISFSIEPGEFVGIVGPSGGGKSTIIDLCLRFYEPEGDRILLDDHDIATVPAHELRAVIGLVSQDLTLWNATVKENLLYGLRRSATWEEVIAVCQKVKVDEFVCRLPQRYDTVVGPRGVKLSGGERQRIALARVFLNDPAVILLDEATAALDTIAEAAVVEAVASLAAAKTRVVVAHRLATVVGADRLLVIDHGAVVEAGAPAALLRHNGLYARLYETQRLPGGANE